MKTLSNWGWHIAPTNSKCAVADIHHGGTLRYCDKPDQTDGSRWLVKFGNNFDLGWKHHLTVSHKNWWFWDNPELPHLLYDNPANPSGAKTFIRWVKGSIMTASSDTPGEQRVNDLLRKLSNNTLTTWRDIVAPRDVRRTRRHALIIASSPNCYRFYYNTTREQWLSKVQHTLEQQGWTWELRIKQGRKARRSNKLMDQLATGHYGLVVNQHSASTMESILAGVPVVCDNDHCGGPLVTQFKDFSEGADPQECTSAEVEQWMQTILGNVRHKSELKGTEW